MAELLTDLYCHLICIKNWRKLTTLYVTYINKWLTSEKMFRASKYLHHFWTISGRKLMEPVSQKKLNFTSNLDAQMTAARRLNAKIWLQNIWILMFGTAILFMLLTNWISSEEISAHFILLFGKYQGEIVFLTLDLWLWFIAIFSRSIWAIPVIVKRSKFFENLFLRKGLL